MLNDVNKVWRSHFWRESETADEPPTMSCTQFLVYRWRPRQAARRCSVLNLEGDRRRLVDVHVLRRHATSAN